ncbi:MAG: YbjN domain-containing protein [Devosiaceae bacterium]|nr:YbjN domain-containing protein [Devosiaceae bacterium MH13]
MSSNALSAPRRSTATKAILRPSATLLFLGALALSAAAQPAHTVKPNDLAPIGQKGPAVTPAPPPEDPDNEPYATNPGGSVGGLLFANLDDLRILAAEVGAARMERDDGGDQYIAGNIDGINYVIDVYNCDPQCADLTFSASFTVDGVTNDQMNEWNRTRRFGKAYRRDDGDAVIQFAINTRFGITVETFRDDLIWWESVLEDYVEYIGFR